MVTLSSSGWTEIHVVIAMVVLITLALILRFIARRKTKTLGRPEEWIIGFAAILFYAANAVYIAMLINPYSGGSLDPSEFTIDEIDNYFKWIIVSSFCFFGCLAAVKVSILFFYKSIFPTQRFKWVANGIAFLSVALCIIASFMTLFRCNPVAATWTLELELAGAQCYNPMALDFYCELVNILLDFMILSLPLFMIGRLQLQARKKFAVSVLFLVGGFACITGIMRMYWTLDLDTPWVAARDNAQIWYWSAVEIASAIFVACLPTYAIFLRGDFLLLSKIKSAFSSLLPSSRRSKMSKTSKMSESSSEFHSRDIESKNAYVFVHGSSVKTSPTIRNDYESDKYPLNRIEGTNIRVTREVQLS